MPEKTKSLIAITAAFAFVSCEQDQPKKTSAFTEYAEKNDIQDVADLKAHVDTASQDQLEELADTLSDKYGATVGTEDNSCAKAVAEAVDRGTGVRAFATGNMVTVVSELEGLTPADFEAIPAADIEAERKDVAQNYDIIDRMFEGQVRAQGVSFKYVMTTPSGTFLYSYVIDAAYADATK